MKYYCPQQERLLSAKETLWPTTEAAGAQTGKVHRRAGEQYPFQGNAAHPI
jgi:hypothetical protein